MHRAGTNTAKRQYMAIDTHRGDRADVLCMDDTNTHTAGPAPHKTDEQNMERSHVFLAKDTPLSLAVGISTCRLVIRSRYWVWIGMIYNSKWQRQPSADITNEHRALAL